ncbi:MAG: PD-(D/E)XK nuclease family protein, partial [Methanoregulaceae archaeon]|nr:PD-(D/E)XK nuclease family protein [Methanoregulaceae archaeon]
NQEGWNTPGAERTFSQSSSAVRAGELIGSGHVCQAVERTGESHTIDEMVGRVNMERYYRTGICDSAYDGVLSGDEQISEALAGHYGPEHIYSATSLETYAECPFHYFLGKVMGLEELPEIEPDLSASDRGTVIHEILSTFYRRWRAGGHVKVSLTAIAEATELMREIAEKELARFSFRSPLWEATCIRMRGGSLTGPGYFEKFLAKEVDEEGSPLAPAHFEFSFGMGKEESDDPASVAEAVELVSQDGSERVRIRGRIDRIDLSPDGSFLIYDYKTGAQHPKYRDIEGGKALQLPLYLLAFESVSGNRGVAAGYYRIRKEVESRMVLCDEAGKCLIMSRTKASPDFAGVIGRSRDYALDYIRRIRKGEFPLPHEEECPNAYCGFRRICRFNPFRACGSGEGS